MAARLLGTAVFPLSLTRVRDLRGPLMANDQVGGAFDRAGGWAACSRVASRGGRHVGAACPPPPPRARRSPPPRVASGGWGGGGFVDGPPVAKGQWRRRG